MGEHRRSRVRITSSRRTEVKDTRSTLATGDCLPRLLRTVTFDSGFQWSGMLLSPHQGRSWICWQHSGVCVEELSDISAVRRFGIDHYSRCGCGVSRSAAARSAARSVCVLYGTGRAAEHARAGFAGFAHRFISGCSGGSNSHGRDVSRSGCGRQLLVTTEQEPDGQCVDAGG